MDRWFSEVWFQKIFTKHIMARVVVLVRQLRCRSSLLNSILPWMLFRRALRNRMLIKPRHSSRNHNHSLYSFCSFHLRKHTRTNYYLWGPFTPFTSGKSGTVKVFLDCLLNDQRGSHWFYATTTCCYKWSLRPPVDLCHGPFFFFFLSPKGRIGIECWWHFPERSNN